MRRIAAFNNGPTKAKRTPLIYAFLRSRIAYFLPYLNRSQTKSEKIIGSFAEYTRRHSNYPTAFLLTVRNHCVSTTLQMNKSGPTDSINLCICQQNLHGRPMFRRLGLRGPLTTDPKEPISSSIHDDIFIHPRNMHTVRNQRSEHRPQARNAQSITARCALYVNTSRTL